MGLLAARRASRAQFGRALRRWCSNERSLSPLGLGYASPELKGVSRTALMRELMALIDQPGRALPGVTSVSVLPAQGDAGLEGGLWRKMVVGEDVILEHIYANPALGTVCRVGLLPDGAEGEQELVTQLRTKPHLHIEIFARDVNSLERIHSDEPLALAKLVVEQTVKLASAKEAQEKDDSFHGNKA